MKSSRDSILAGLLACAALAAPSAAVRQAAPAPPGAAAARSSVPAVFEPYLVHLASPGTPGTVVSVPARLGGAAPEILLEGVQWLPVDFVGRTGLDLFLPDRPRHLADVEGASRLILPAARGALYRYRRDAGAASVFGFLRVSQDGRARVAVERRGTGAAFDQDPWVGRVAVSPDGRSLLAATTVPAGGDLLEIGLERDSVVDRTAGLGAFDFSDAGLWLNDDWGFGVAGQGVLRFAREPGATSELVDFGPGGPTWYSGQAVVSLNREFAATTAGTGVDAQLAWVFGRTGPAIAAGEQPALLAGAGFQPEAPHGPFLAVSDDGTLCAWKRLGQTEMVSNEGFLARVQVGPAQASQVTADEYLVDTLDEVGIIGFLRPGLLIIGVGERDAVEGIDQTEFLEVSLAADGSPVHTNVSLTSGDATVPFSAAGEIDPTAVHRTADARLVMHDDRNDRVIAVDPESPGVTQILGGVKDLLWTEQAGGELLLAVRREVDPRPMELWSVPAALAGAQLVHQASPDAAYRHPVRGDGGWVACALLEPFSGERPLRVQLPGGVVQLADPLSTRVVPPLAQLGDGALLYRSDEPVGEVHWYRWPAAGTAAHDVPVLQADGHPLPGR